MPPAVMSALVALAVSAALGRPVLVLLRRLGALDVPNDRSSHVRPVPRGGGLAPAAGILAAVALSTQVVGASRLALVLGAGAFGMIGLIDDLVGIPVALRFCLQLGAALVACRWLSADLGGTVLGSVAVAVGVTIWVVAYVNAYNFMDGIDGMSVAQAVVAGVTWWLLGETRGVPALATGGAVVAAAAVGFAPYNLPRARLFLGDVGSYFLGASLATLAVLGLRAGLAPEAVLAPLALYLADTGTTLARRAARGETWYLPHRDHVYQRLTRLGWAHLRTTLVVTLWLVACSALGAVSLVDGLLLRVVADLCLLGLLGAYLALPWLIFRRVEGRQAALTSCPVDDSFAPSAAEFGATPTG